MVVAELFRICLRLSSLGDIGRLDAGLCHSESRPVLPTGSLLGRVLCYAGACTFF